jgi:hypothetical protein
MYYNLCIYKLLQTSLGDLSKKPVTAAIFHLRNSLLKHKFDLNDTTAKQIILRV